MNSTATQTSAARQLRLPLTDAQESRESRLQRLLSGQLRNVIRQASAMTFDKRAQLEAERKAGAFR